MHRYRIVAQISLILSILNIVLAAPIVVQEMHEARDPGDEIVVAEDQLKKLHELDAASDRSTSTLSPPDAIASPQHSSSGYPSPYLSSDVSVSGYSWMLDRPPRLSPNPASSPHPSSSGSSEIPTPWWLQELAPGTPTSSHSAGSSEIPLLEWAPEWAPEEIPPTPPQVFHGLVHSHPNIISSGSSEILGSASDQETTGTYSTERFTSSYQPSSLSTDRISADSESTPTPHASAPASDESLSSHDSSASDELVHSPHPMSEELAPSHHSTSDGASPSPSSPPIETPPDNEKFFNKGMMKKIKIVAGATILTAVIAGIVGATQIKHKHRDIQDNFQDS